MNTRENLLVLIVGDTYGDNLSANSKTFRLGFSDRTLIHLKYLTVGLVSSISIARRRITVHI
jgi:hypothetical protein